MGSLERDLKRLEDKADYQRTELVCTVCGWEVTVYGDVWLDLIVLDWEAGQPEGYEDPYSTFAPHPNVVELHAHEHPAEDFIEKRSGLPLYHPTVSEMGVAPDPRLDPDPS